MDITHLSKKIIQFILIEMLYKKYVIEVIYETKVIEHVTIQSNNSYDNQIQLNLTPIEKTINTIKFMSPQGHIEEYEHYFDTYEKAFDTLSTHYYSSDAKIVTFKIVTVLNDIVPPTEVLRSMKIKNILK